MSARWRTIRKNVECDGCTYVFDGKTEGLAVNDWKNNTFICKKCVDKIHKEANNQVLEMIPLIDCCGLPDDANEWCIEREISTHYQNDVVSLEDNGNPLAEWLKKDKGFIFKSKYEYIALNAT